LFGGTGSDSIRQEMPDYLPDRVEAGTINVPGVAGLTAGMAHLRRLGVENIGRQEQSQAKLTAEGLKKLGLQVFSGPHQGGTVSFVPTMDCEDMAQRLAQWGIAVRAGLHCAPLAHESAGTLQTGTVRISFGHDASTRQTRQFLATVAALT
jgi:selenocysteine lyase/cysteine desulfurase